MVTTLLVRTLVLVGGAASIGFGTWHFFVPSIWRWYSYIDINVRELVPAVRATNLLFSLSLVLFGLINLLVVYGGRPDRYSVIIVLAATCILWLARVGMQLVYSQGSMNPALQYGMLVAFVLISMCYVVSLAVVLWQ